MSLAFEKVPSKARGLTKKAAGEACSCSPSELLYQNTQVAAEAEQPDPHWMLISRRQHRANVSSGSYSDDPGRARLQLHTSAEEGKPNPTALFLHKGAPGNTTRDRFPWRCLHIECGRKRTNRNRRRVQIHSSQLCTHMPKSAYFACKHQTPSARIPPPTSKSRHANCKVGPS